MEHLGKTDSMHLECREESGTDTKAKFDTLPNEIPIDEKLEKKIKRKIDHRLIPILGFLYTLSLIDRTNIGGARISGLDGAVDLDIGNRASVIILVFYVGYVIFELPSNIVLKKVGAANWLSFLGISWGVIVLSFGFSKNWATVAALRVLLGILEAGLFPGCIYLISSWYRRYEVQKRIAFFFMTASFLSSFSNILAYGLTQIASDPETDGWKWIFIVEGALTIGLAILAFFIIVDFPESKRNRFLSPEEIQIVKQRLIQERGTTEAGKVTWKVIRETVSDWQVWSIATVYMTGSCGTYGFLFFLPIILRNGLEYSMALSFILTAPPAALAVIYAVGISWAADRYHVRGPFILLHCVLAIVGLCMIGFLGSPTPRYIGAFPGECGTNGLIVTGLAWGQNNVRGDAKRSVTTAIQVMMAAVGGIYSALVFRQQDAPDYIPGLVATGALVLLAGALTLVTCPLLIHANRKADVGQKIIEGAVDFRYTW
ncbi:uncharacterized protein Z518_07365 [Rhinocladiella mackenziei CBS 650.93]|uniref:Rhinocladiella mackenziei CBS 650.93 unplaced genomic scaffold supercont1.5, whole genome shotgun sequence n=1 Tax=Rhinocladiella mackenziei CBS 650.93 TaxID=1442369 RepID=A0A0D2FNX6_9EURO|nr:uncharacterized protein Z518_07365 [Rhinocladiella mackenziei CBS 650.93]KIX03812.1 hypothetical protein Z518_07365 [Rhinocladiella mackenziei CBS 650.93]